jgi:hypothetical protein
MGRLGARTLNKLASISALGAGALALAPDSAQASVIAYNGAPITLLFTSGPGGSGSGSPPWYAGSNSSLPLPTPGLFAFGLYSCTCGHVKAGILGAGVYFATQSLGTATGSGSNYFVRLFNSGAFMPGLGYPGYSPIASFVTSGSNLLSGGNGQFSHKFALFSFYNTSQSAWDFGWAEISLAAINNLDGTISETLTIENYAYDDSGALLAAGDLTGVPEPGTMGSMAMGALALGAVGLRRWRAARRKTA